MQVFLEICWCMWKWQDKLYFLFLFLRNRQTTLVYSNLFILVFDFLYIPWSRSFFRALTLVVAKICNFNTSKSLLYYFSTSFYKSIPIKGAKNAKYYFFSIFSTSNDKNMLPSNILNPKRFSTKLQWACINTSSI